jgi:hypothetical protein
LGSTFAVSRGGGVARFCGGSWATGGSSSTGSGGGGSTTLASITRGGTGGTSRFGRSDGDFACADAHAALPARHPIAISKSNFLISTRLNLQNFQKPSPAARRADHRTRARAPSRRTRGLSQQITPAGIST